MLCFALLVEGFVAPGILATKPLGNGANMRSFCCFKLVLAAVVYANEPCCCGDACKAGDLTMDVETHVASVKWIAADDMTLR